MFDAVIDIIGVNPFVAVPDDILTTIFVQSGKTSGAIPVAGLLNGRPYTQTLVRYKGLWRLYINTMMLKQSPRRVGETITLTIAYDPIDRTIAAHPKWVEALADNPEARTVYDAMSPSRQQEMLRYFAKLKSEERVLANVAKAIGFLLGKNRFVGRDKP
ncbi:YdeI/OmpD-associated family protein [Spirosoma rhododendri]|uniref:DUF1905 domain-containing protein n=1 Tax=Spirosoma rhododendri TaxID=2728024 RepID=A0A7L5DQX8_9BACT|nr:YdeI/OmpD-associated family protein [Spirosoma rhododendri]QJD80816.1 DUF1905 domain-containing protein [Spirosoma rhododendri]